MVKGYITNASELAQAFSDAPSQPSMLGIPLPHLEK